jgi:hypothetical protein
MINASIETLRAFNDHTEAVMANDIEFLRKMGYPEAAQALTDLAHMLSERRQEVEG